MYQDYLEEREKYRRRQLARQQKQRQRISKQVVRSNTGANRYIQQSRNFQRKTERQFNGLLFTARAISGTLKLMSNIMKSQAGLIMVGAVALLSAIKGFKSNQEFNEQYKEEFAGVGSGMSSGRMSQKGLNDLANLEGGYKLKAYDDGYGILTIGVGHTGQVDGKPITPGMTITREKAEELFRKDIAKFEKAVNDRVKVPITQNMFDALVSLVFNTGENGANSVFAKINQGDFKGAAEAMKQINKVTDKKTGKKVVSQGLVNRRAKEVAKFLSDLDSNGKIKEEVSDPTKKYSDVQLSNYATKSGGGKGKADKTAVSGKFGGYTTSKGVQIGKSAAKVLSQIEGSGTITSGLGDTHATKSKHYTGHAVDVGMGGVGNDKAVETCINFLKHPAVAWIYVETFEKDLNWARGVVKAVKERVPQLCKGDRISAGTSKHVTGRHLHIEFDYNYIDKPQANYNIKKENEAKPIPKKEEKSKTTIQENGNITGGAANIIMEEEQETPVNYVNTAAINMGKAKRSGKNIVNKTKKS